MELEKIKEVKYGPFTTELKITRDVKSFLGFDLHLLNFDSDEWYQKWLLKYLDEDKDAIPDEKFGKNFELIYCSIIQNPEDYINVEDILEELEINKENLIFDGSVEIPGRGIKFWVRWVVVKKIS